jgi:hypothetical protein
MERGVGALPELRAVARKERTKSRALTLPARGHYPEVRGPADPADVIVAGRRRYELISRSSARDSLAKTIADAPGTDRKWFRRGSRSPASLETAAHRRIS